MQEMKDFGKYEEAVERWKKEREISFEDNAQQEKLRLVVKFLNNNEMADTFFDGNMNGLTFEEAVLMFKLQLDAKDYVTPANAKYTVVEISSYDEHQKYKSWTDDWCVSISEFAFEEYSKRGKLILLLRNDYRKVPKKPGTTFPNDSYGNSIYCVIKKNDGNIESITNRWNIDACQANEINKFMNLLNIE